MAAAVCGEGRRKGEGFGGSLLSLDGGLSGGGREKASGRGTWAAGGAAAQRGGEAAGGGR
jgi:hypothetical protein